jgi:Na+-translocating ferredoxin:NAD+ oxidoreductase RnfD subunit
MSSFCLLLEQLKLRSPSEDLAQMHKLVSEKKIGCMHGTISLSFITGGMSLFIGKEIEVNLN